MLSHASWLHQLLLAVFSDFFQDSATVVLILMNCLLMLIGILYIVSKSCHLVVVMMVSVSEWNILLTIIQCVKNLPFGTSVAIINGLHVALS